MGTQNCIECRFYEQYEPALSDDEIDLPENADDNLYASPISGYGRCRRYPPVSHPTNQQESDFIGSGITLWSHPAVSGSNWCGEFKDREP
jgi:hypothetical protein